MRFWNTEHRDRLSVPSAKENLQVERIAIDSKSIPDI